MGVEENINFDPDEVINSAYEPTPPRPDSQEEQQTENNPMEQYKFTANGKEIVPESPDKLKRWAQMGYDYSNNVNRLKEKEESLNGLADKYSYYEQIEQKAQQNPDWWDHVQRSFQQSDSYNGNSQYGNFEQAEQTGYDPRYQEVESKLSKMENFFNQWQAEQKQAQIEQEDQALAQEITNYKQEYNFFDWDSPDDRGLTLDDRVLIHMKDQGIPNFKTAFRDLMHDDLIKRAKLEAQENLTTTIKKNKQNGLLGDVPTPIKNFNQKDIRDMSYDEIVTQTLQEYGMN